MRIIVTGAAGFIGYHLCKNLIKKNLEVIGIDNFNDYYDQSLKESRNKELVATASASNNNFSIHRIDLENFNELKRLAYSFKPNIIINLAAQAGVRYSITNPSAYIQSNIVGFANILEISRGLKVQNLLYASSSSVYGGNKNIPFKETDNVDHPISLYAASKKSNELMAHTYSHLYGLPAIGMRFFTVYGPWGRPDMALFKFTKAIIENKPIEVFNDGKMTRDFTYIDDVIESIIRLMSNPPQKSTNFNYQVPDPSSSWAPHHVFNIGNCDPIDLEDFIRIIEEELNLKANKVMLPMQPGDVASTASDTKKLLDWIDYKPQTNIKLGIKKFIEWYKNYYKHRN